MTPYSPHDDPNPYEVVAQPPRNGYDVAENQRRNLMSCMR